MDLWLWANQIRWNYLYWSACCQIMLIYCSLLQICAIKVVNTIFENWTKVGLNYCFPSFYLKQTKLLFVCVRQCMSVHFSESLQQFLPWEMEVMSWDEFYSHDMSVESMMVKYQFLASRTKWVPLIEYVPICVSSILQLNSQGFWNRIMYAIFIGV